MTTLDEPRTDPRRMEELEEQAKYARRRYDLYKARTYGPRPSSPARLGELKRDAERAEARVERAGLNA